MPTPSQLDEAGDAVRSVIRAYHGSPYDFDRFDASKIGTGEGAQAYGYGHYFSAEEDVARTYRDELREAIELPVPPELNQNLDRAYGAMQRAAADARSASPSDWAVMRMRADEAWEAYARAQNEFRSASHNPGHMYEVEINFPASRFLDRDRPLLQQPEIMRLLGPDWLSTIRSAAGNDLDGYGLYDFQKLMSGSPERASRALLKEHGIPGIAYEDEIGRYSERGSRNYVMFPGTEDSIRILRKFGLLAPVAAGAGAASMGGEE